jgi:hypothetical protein
MAENVVEVDLGVEWEPNGPEAVMLTDDGGRTALALGAHFDDEDQRAVVLFWTGAQYRSMASPNDEARNGHRLYGRGLKGVLWIAEVHESELITALERQNSVHPRHDPAMFASLTHHIVLTKEETIEVVARSLAVMRLSGSSWDAARAAFLEA